MNPLTKTDLLSLISLGENSAVEFKRDELRPESLAKELVAFGNFESGRLLLGVEDDGVIDRAMAFVQQYVADPEMLYASFSSSLVSSSGLAGRSGAASRLYCFIGDISYPIYI
jgi:hypothetical protein